ncbi:MAG TPA: transaldolase [Prolixibacteraceae bacterium]|nr:transaldolase [Prolixibacteraceae bacterium]
MHILEQLRRYSKIVADSGDFESIRKFKPLDSTTNPSLILAAAQEQKYAHLIDEALAYARRRSTDRPRQINIAVDKLFINFGLEILKIVPGRVSTQVDARMSFDNEGSVKKAREVIAMYKEAGIDRERVLVEIASTWEGIRAADTLSKEGIHCNMTLMFSLPQAIACAEAKVKLISPFVGRVLDWHSKTYPQQKFTPDAEPGVQLVKDIYHYYKKFGYKTEIMAASFRNQGEILALAGCDLITIPLALLSELERTEGNLERKLIPEKAQETDLQKMDMDQKKFRFMMNEDIMASEKLAEGIKKFNEDVAKLESLLLRRYVAKYETL